MKQKIYVARCTKDNELTNYKDCWFYEYHNSYSGRSWKPCVNLKDATFYVDPGCDGMVEKINQSCGFEFEVIEFEAVKSIKNKKKTG